MALTNADQQPPSPPNGGCQPPNQPPPPPNEAIQPPFQPPSPPNQPPSEQPLSPEEQVTLSKSVRILHLRECNFLGKNDANGARRDERRLIERTFCASSVAYWVNNWAWTYDPRLPDPLLPFDLYPCQAAFLEWVGQREKRQQDGVLEKSRDMGASWLCCAYALHGWLFRRGYQVGFGSRKLEYVDEKGDPKSIFEKLRLLLHSLPHWMCPAGFRWDKHSGHAKLLNPENGASITGEGGDNIGRGGRASIYFVDEAAFLERPQMVDRALSQTTRCRIDVSTPNGPGNPFAEKRFRLPREQIFTLHWKDDPRKGEAWYAEQKERYDAVTVAQEIDIDYTASVDGICVPAKWVRAAVGLSLPVTGDPVGGLDIGGEGSNLSVLVPRRGPVVSDPVDWQGLLPTQCAGKARIEAERLGLRVLAYDADGIGSGVKDAWNASEVPLPFETRPVHGGLPAGDDVWPDGVTSKQKFTNVRSMLWWKLRMRFERTYEYVNDEVPHPPEDMISLPNHPQLIAELSLPLVEHTDTGKIKLESKLKMKSRGVKSPDFADALAYSFFLPVECASLIARESVAACLGDIEPLVLPLGASG